MNEQNSLVPQEQEQKSIVFGASTASGVIAKAQEVAKSLSPLVEQAKLYVTISNRKYVKAEGWTTMLSMLGVFPTVEFSRRVEDDEHITYEARIVLKTAKGQEVGAGEAICSSKEKSWKNREEFAIKSMAQTRAIGKAARLSFSWIMALSGYEATPAEEMTHEVAGKPTVVPPQAKHVISDSGKSEMLDIMNEMGWPERKVELALQKAELVGEQAAVKGLRDQYEKFLAEQTK